MTRVVRCTCGTEVRHADEAELIRQVQQHARDAHDLVLSDDQVRDMVEVEP
ncbi:MAG: DUF1059 domain-containing protein [Chloroflexota bacterium]|nr:DUF1059 domain-containing protein [Chloroflexota bacterium]